MEPTIIDEEERRDLMSLVVDAYDIFIDRVVDLRSLTYERSIDPGIMYIRLRNLSLSLIRLYYLVNMHIDGENIMDRYNKLMSEDHRRMSDGQRREYIEDIIRVVNSYQKILGKTGLLPLLNKKITGVI